MKETIISVIIATILIGGAFMLTKSGGERGEVAGANNVSIVDGKQIIEIKARGGYFPQKSIAKAGIPTILRLKTSGTFDCSSAISIPSMKISKMLPQSGSTDIDLGSPQVGTLQGTCSMGMYFFEIDFQE